MMIFGDNVINIIYRLAAPKFIEEVYDDFDINKGVIVRPTYLSISEADQSYFFGKITPGIKEQILPITLINESVGIVIKDNTHTFDVGDNVLLIPNFVNDKEFQRYNGEESKFNGTNSGFMKEYVSLDKDRLIKLPEDINLEVASFIGMISKSVNAINQFKKFSHERRDNIAIWGDGNLGYITAFCLKMMLPESKIFVFGTHIEKLSMFTFVDKTCLIDEIPNNIDIDHAFECVGKYSASDAFDQIIDIIKPEGTISLLGVSESNILINTRKILEKNLKIFGTIESTKEDFYMFLDLIEENQEKIHYLESFITEVIEINKLNDIKKAFEYDKNIRFGKTVMKWNI